MPDPTSTISPFKKIYKQLCRRWHLWFVLFDKTAYFRVNFHRDQFKAHLSLIVLFNQHLDMKHLWCRWIILAKGKRAHLEGFQLICALTLRSFLFTEKVWDFLLQLMEKGSKNKIWSVYFLMSVIFLMDENCKYGKKIMYIFLCEFYHCTECKVTLQSVTISEMSSRRLSGIPKLKLQYKIEVIICYFLNSYKIQKGPVIANCSCC